MWTLKALVNNYDDGVVVGYSVGQGASFTSTSSVTAGNLLIIIPNRSSLNFVDMSMTTVWPFGQAAAVFIARGDDQAWLYQYTGNGSVTCTINSDGSVSMLGENGVIVPLPVGPFETGGSTSSFVATAAAFSDGTIVGGQADPEHYVMYGGAKFWIPSLQVASSLNLDMSRAQTISDADLSAIPIIPMGGTLLRELNSQTTYVMQGAQKSRILSATSLDKLGGGNMVRVLPEHSLDIIADGADIN